MPTLVFMVSITGATSSASTTSNTCNAAFVPTAKSVQAPSLSSIINFGAGPAALPSAPLKQFLADLQDFEGFGVGVGELSHRSEEFEVRILKAANEAVYKLTGYKGPEGSLTWRALWMTGGGTGQFSAVPLNLLYSSTDSVAVYLITGTWSSKAAQEASRLFPGRVVAIDCRLRSKEEGRGLLSPEVWLKEVPGADRSIAYFYYCDNETVDGLELPDPNYFQNILNGEASHLAQVPFVGDLSSNFMSRALPDPSGCTELLFGGVQKNLGASGVTLVLIKDSLLKALKSNKATQSIPTVLDYLITAQNDSLYNTPPVMNIRLTQLVLEDLITRFPGGLGAVGQFSSAKADKLYAALDAHPHFYNDLDKQARSRMNVVFWARDPAKEAEFLELAGARGMIQLRGHRSVGGLRASLYNAITLEQVDSLISLLNSIK